MDISTSSTSTIPLVHPQVHRVHRKYTKFIDKYTKYIDKSTDHPEALVSPKQIHIVQKKLTVGVLYRRQ
jgi:hypothetical protein